MSYHLQSYFPGIYFTAEFTFLSPPGIRTLPETNVLCLAWRYLSAEVDFAQTWEKKQVVLDKLFPGLAEICISFTGCFFFFFLLFWISKECFSSQPAFSCGELFSESINNKNNYNTKGIEWKWTKQKLAHRLPFSLVLLKNVDAVLGKLQGWWCKLKLFQP